MQCLAKIADVGQDFFPQRLASSFCRFARTPGIYSIFVAKLPKFSAKMPFQGLTPGVRSRQGGRQIGRKELRQTRVFRNSPSGFAQHQKKQNCEQYKQIDDWNEDEHFDFPSLAG